MDTNPYLVPQTRTGVGSIGLYDLNPDVRDKILHHSHPVKTVDFEWVAPDSTITRYEFTRERKRILGHDLLKISITRRAGTAEARTHTWHNISRIRQYLFVHSHYELTFVGKVADNERARRFFGQHPSLAQSEKVFYLPYASNDWENWLVPRAVYEKERHKFEELGLTLRRIRDESGEEVSEYIFPV